MRGNQESAQGTRMLTGAFTGCGAVKDDLMQKALTYHLYL